MSADNGPTPEVKTGLLTLDKKLPGPFTALQNSYGLTADEVDELIARAKQHDQAHARWNAMRQPLANRNPLFTGDTDFIVGFDGYLYEYLPPEALQRMVGISRGINRSVNHVNDHRWGLKEKLIKTLDGVAFHPEAVELAEELFHGAKSWLQSGASPAVRAFRDETAEFISRYPEAGVRYQQGAKGTITGQQIVLPIFPDIPGAQRLVLTPDTLNPTERDLLLFFVKICRMAHPLSNVLTKGGVLDDLIKDVIASRIPTYDGITHDPIPRTYISFPPYPTHAYSEPTDTLDPSFYGKAPPPVEYTALVEDPRAKPMGIWQKQCTDAFLARLKKTGGKYDTNGISTVYGPVVRHDEKTHETRITPERYTSGTWVLIDDFARELAGVVRLQQERCNATEGQLSPLVPQLYDLQKKKITSVIYNGKVYPIATQEQVAELASLIPPYTSIVQIDSTPEGTRTIATVSGGWNDPHKTPLYLGNKLAVGPQYSVVSQNVFTVSKLPSINLPTGSRKGR